MKNRNIGFGIFLLSIGIILLLINFGVINWTILGTLLDFWPAILIVIGINIIFRHNEIVRIITWVIFLGALISYSYFFGSWTGNFSGDWSKSENVKIEKSLETEKGELKLALGGTRITLDSTGSELILADLSDPYIVHKINLRDGNKVADVDFEQKRPFPININTGSKDCRFSLNDSISWDIDIDTGAVNGTLDMSNLKIDNIDLDTGAANLNLTFGNKNKSTDVKVDAGASNIDVIVPANTGVKVKLDVALSNTNLRSLGWNKQGDYYISPNYESAESKIFFDVDMGAGKFYINLK